MGPRLTRVPVSVLAPITVTCESEAPQLVVWVIGLTEQAKAPQDRVAISIDHDAKDLGCCVTIHRGSHRSVRIGRFPIRGPS